jgi:hypothetical protein
VSAHPYALALGAAATACAFLMPLAWRNRRQEGGPALVAVMAASFLWALFAALESGCLDPGRAVWFAKATYLGSAFLAPALLFFSLRVTGNGRTLTPAVTAALLIIPTFSVFLAATNEWHHLFWTFVPAAPGPGRLFLLGPFWWVLLGYSAAGTLASAGLIGRSAVQGSGSRRRVMVVTLAAMGIPWAGQLLSVLPFNPFPGLNYPPLLVAATCALMLVTVTRLRLFDIIPLARGMILEVLGDGVVVLDGSGKVIDSNPAARGLAGVAGPGITEVSEALGPWKDLLSSAAPGEAREAASPADPGRTVEVRAFPLAARGQKASGRMLIIRDVTERKAEEAERERLIGELRSALADVRALSGLLPICARCKKIRDDSGYWREVEQYIMSRSNAVFSHGLCPDCIAAVYPELEEK